MSEWQLLHQHYMKVKKEHLLLTCDIVRQLGEPNYYSYKNYLSPEGINRTPSTRPGTVGRKMRDLLKTGLDKTDWKPSTASYENKLSEMPIDHMYMSVHISDYEHKGAVEIPILSVNLTMDEGPMMSKEQLAFMFTIDGVVPIIGEVNKCYQLVLREDGYIPIGDR